MSRKLRREVAAIRALRQSGPISEGECVDLAREETTGALRWYSSPGEITMAVREASMHAWIFLRPLARELMREAMIEDLCGLVQDPESVVNIAYAEERVLCAPFATKMSPAQSGTALSSGK